jgi:hypothetical protein
MSNSKYKIVTVSPNAEKYIKSTPRTQPSRHSNRLYALSKTFGGKLCTKQQLLDWMVNYIMQDPNYNLQSKKYNGDHTDSSNAKLEAGKAYACYVRDGFFIEIE